MAEIIYYKDSIIIEVYHDPIESDDKYSFVCVTKSGIHFHCAEHIQGIGFLG